MNKSNFRFSDPILLKFTFEINENFLAEAEKEFYVGQKFHVEVSRNPSEAGCASVVLNLELGEKTADCPFFLSIAEGANFRWDNDSYSEEQQEKLLTQNAPALLLSYMRPLVASATAASPYPAYHFPFIYFTKEES